jgi:tol-pal system protein YbgF
MKRPSATALLSLALLSLVTLGCAGNPLSREDPRDQEIQELRARIVELQRKATVNEVEVARLREQVAQLETARPGGTRAAAVPAPAPLQAMPAATAPPAPPAPAAPKRQAPAPRPAAPTSSTSSPTSIAQRVVPAKPAPAPSRPAAPAPRTSVTAGGIEEADIDVPAAATAPRQKAASGQQSVKIRDAEPLRPNPTLTAPPASPAPPAGGPETSGPATQALYDRGYTLFHQGRYVDAEASFQRFLQANPGNELADNAQYWIGECRYSRGDLRGALSAFRETVARYPDGNKVPDALLKAGQSLEGMGDVEGARVTYKEVIRRFAGSAAATVAEERQAKLPR